MWSKFANDWNCKINQLIKKLCSILWEIKKFINNKNFRTNKAKIIIRITKIVNGKPWIKKIGKK